MGFGVWGLGLFQDVSAWHVKIDAARLAASRGCALARWSGCVSHLFRERLQHNPCADTEGFSSHMSPVRAAGEA